MKRSLLAVVVLGAACAMLQAQGDAIEIKIGKPKAGDTARLTKTKKTSIDMAGNIGGQEIKQTQASDDKFVYVETILERPDPKKKETKATRLYETAENTKDGKVTKYSFEKKTVTVEKKDGKYTFTVDGKPLTGAEKAILAKDYDGEDDTSLEEDLLPGKPVKVGDEWKVDAAKIFMKKGKDNPFTIDAEKTKGSAKLTKVYMKDAQRCGVIDFTATLPVKTMKLGPNDTAMKAGSAMTVTVSMDVCIDGSAPYGGAVLSVKMDLNADIPGGTMTLKGGEDAEMKAEKVK